ncbi:MAG: hypothetical protein QNJ57_07945 [Flavobacteriaceae bacterium]|nr:hypothetical protein [Flavobacteriaceae bacterium]
MRIIIILLFLSAGTLTFAQKNLTLQLIDSISLDADVFAGVDDFENIYYTKGTTFYKKTAQQTYSYANTPLGTIAAVDITNPLKILIFYRDFNTLVILDNRLNELSDRINLSDATYGKNAVFATISSNNNLWLYSLDDNVLTLWNYETKQAIFDSQPLQFYKDSFEAKNQVSTYENCWLLSEKSILEFNEYGSFIKETALANVSMMTPYKRGFIYTKGTILYFHENDTTTEVTGMIPEHLSTNYFVNKNTFYFFRSGWLYRYSILKN